MRIHYFIHIPEETPGEISAWAGMNNHTETYTHFHDDFELPQLDDFDMLVVMGGTMNVYEENKFPWLVLEKQFLKQAIEKGKKVLGICFGAQLISCVLGGAVVKNDCQEIGWFPVYKTVEGKSNKYLRPLADVQSVLHWHGDKFLIPENCENLITSKACENQAFAFEDHVLALQFHIEVHAQIVKDWANWEPLKKEDWVQTADEIMNYKNWMKEGHESLHKMLDLFAADQEK